MPGATADARPFIVRCNLCNTARDPRTHPCNKCRCYEYRIEYVTEEPSMSLNVPDGEAPELLERLLEYDQTVEELEAEIAVAKEGLDDLKDTLKDTLAARAKLSAGIRHPSEMPGGKAKKKGA